MHLVTSYLPVKIHVSKVVEFLQLIVINKLFFSIDYTVVFDDKLDTHKIIVNSILNRRYVWGRHFKMGEDIN